MRGNSTPTLNDMIGRTVNAIFWSEGTLVFMTDAEPMAYAVEGECCSHSYFHDFYGVEHLLKNGPVISAEDIELAPGDADYRAKTWEEGVGSVDYGEVEVYGYRLTTEHPLFGPVSSVVSFRNSSNGYYGGWMQRVDPREIDRVFTLIRCDITGE